MSRQYLALIIIGGIAVAAFAQGYRLKQRMDGIAPSATPQDLSA